MKSKRIDLSKPRRRYYSDECNLTICPECGAGLIKEDCAILLSVRSDSDEGNFMTSLSGSHFCDKCPVVVFDNDKVEQAAIVGMRGGKNLRYMVVGIVNLDSIPDDKKHLEIGSDENPMPLVEFLPDKKKQPVIDKKPGRNDLCLCGSGKKYKHCCGK
jgi:SEC-C motif